MWRTGEGGDDEEEQEEGAGTGAHATACGRDAGGAPPCVGCASATAEDMRIRMTVM